jgi:hypothetical protein
MSPAASRMRRSSGPVSIEAVSRSIQAASLDISQAAQEHPPDAAVAPVPIRRAHSKSRLSTTRYFLRRGV